MTAPKKPQLKAFGSQSADEAPTFATTGFRVSAQHALNKAFRESGITRAEFARRAGVSRSAISHALNDGRARTIDALARYVAALGYQVRVEVSIHRRDDWNTRARSAGRKR